jgi:hypothetical protein
MNDGTKGIIAGSGLEWAYVFDEQRRRMYVLQARTIKGKQAIGMFGVGPDGCHWFEAAALELDGPEPDWNEVEKAERTVSTLQEEVSA